MDQVIFIVLIGVYEYPNNDKYRGIWKNNKKNGHGNKGVNYRHIRMRQW